MPGIVLLSSVIKTKQGVLDLWPLITCSKGMFILPYVLLINNVLKRRPGKNLHIMLNIKEDVLSDKAISLKKIVICLTRIHIMAAIKPNLAIVLHCS